MKLGESVERVVDVITEILAFLTVALILVMYINRYFGFIPANVTAILEGIREIAVLLVVGLAGLQFALKRGIVVFIIYALIVAAAIIFMFFPGVLPFTQAASAVLPIL